METRRDIMEIPLMEEQWDIKEGIQTGQEENTNTKIR